MLPPPPVSRNSSYAYRPAPSPALHADTYDRPGPSRTPSHARHASYTSVGARTLRGKGKGKGRAESMGRSYSYGVDTDVDVDDLSRAARTSADSEAEADAELDELREEIMGADDARATRRGLEETLEELGFGAYHWRLLALCGFGWMSDNSALQCIAVILPRVQVHYNLSSETVGLLSSSTMAGMMVGAIGWGTLSDILGRSLPFNMTLFLTAIFGIGASFSPNFPVLLFWMFLLGSAVGGSMPTDGTLFLENLPHSKQYLLTLLSVFFSLGAVLSSVVSYLFLPGNSCAQFEGCDIAGGANEGWRKVLFVLGLFNLCCAFARWFLLRLQESPRYLVTNGREQEAVVALRAIATYNDNEIDITPADIAFDPHASHAPSPDPETATVYPQRDKKDSELPSPSAPDTASSVVPHERSNLPAFIHTGSEEGRASFSGDRDRSAPSSAGLAASGSSDRPPSYATYDAVGLGPPPPPRRHPIRAGSAFYSASYDSPAADGAADRFDVSFGRALDERQEDGEEEQDGLIGGTAARARDTSAPKRSGALGVVLGWAEGWSAQMGKLFVPQWRRTVILMWIIWGSISFSYTMFNVWLPAVLESRAKGEGDEVIKAALKDFVLYSAAGCPGSILGAWMIQTSLGRRKSLAICTLATGVSTFIFIRVKSDTAVVVSSMFISMAATAMYAVLYGMTPETFGTAIRGTACGTSAALSRLTGVMAPVSAGALLSIAPSLPVFVSAAIFTLTAGCSLLLPFERITEGGRGAVMAH